MTRLTTQNKVNNFLSEKVKESNIKMQGPKESTGTKEGESMGTFMFYSVIFTGFFFLVIRPLQKRYGIKAKSLEIPKGKSFSESFSEDIITNPAYDNLRENIYHRD